MISMTSFTPPPMCDAERSTSVSRGGREPDLSGMDMSCESVRSPTCNTWGCRLAHVDMGLQAWLEVVARVCGEGCVARVRGEERGECWCKAVRPPPTWNERWLQPWDLQRQITS